MRFWWLTITLLLLSRAASAQSIAIEVYVGDPPANATSSAGESPRRAAAVVRTFAFVATRIPAQPDEAEATAPITNDSAMIGLCPAPLFEIARSVATTATKIASTRYSAFRNASAPS